MPPGKPNSPAKTPPRIPFRSMPTFRLENLSNLVSKHADLSYQRMFGMRTVECRIIGVVGAFGPVTLRRVCADTGVDKSHGSRMVAKLVGDGVLERRDDAADQRSFYLVLSPKGRRLYARLNVEASARNQAWMEGLPEEHREIFLACLDRLTERARQLLASEAANGEERAIEASGHDVARPDEERAPLLVDVELAQRLHRMLGSLLEERNEQD